MEAHRPHPKQRTPLPAIWTGGDARFSFDSPRCRPVVDTPVLASPMSPRRVVADHRRLELMHPRPREQVTELARQKINSCRPSHVDTAVASPLSSAFNSMTPVGRPTEHALNTALLLSGLPGSQAVPPVSVPPPSRRASIDMRHHPDSIFVTAVAPRSPSSPQGDQPVELPAAADGLVSVTTRVFPRAKHIKPFSLARRFDLRQVRKSISGPPRRLSAGVPASPSTPVRTVVDRGQRFAVVRTLGGRKSVAADLGDFSHQLDNTRPMTWAHARLCLPIIASMMLSGHIHNGDRLEIPMPHPDAWPQTWAYVCGGQGEPLDEATKRNILYLGGKI